MYDVALHRGLDKNISGEVAGVLCLFPEFRGYWPGGDGGSVWEKGYTHEWHEAGLFYFQCVPCVSLSNHPPILCVRVCMCMYVCVQFILYVCAHVSEGQRLTLEASINCSPPYFYRLGFSLSLELVS